jgi:hypothetical protein
MLPEFKDLLFDVNKWEMWCYKDYVSFNLLTPNSTVLWIKQIKGLFSTRYEPCEELKTCLSKYDLGRVIVFIQNNARYIGQETLMRKSSSKTRNYIPINFKFGHAEIG